MEKRKVFKISIIDKEISRAEFDRNTFYTSDSELTLVFKLIERDYSYDHGEILLYNENDESFVTREITKQDNDFVYELDSDIIPHYGTWKAQLQLVNDGDVYTSKPFEFTIVNDLSNLAPQPTLTDINNWATLKQSANELIDEMQDIIIDVERSELERVNKENYRQQNESERSNNENVRQQVESERVKQENIRQKAESNRENNEKQRRIAEFERVDKEKVRQQAEQQRSEAEILRVERDANLNSKITKIEDASFIKMQNSFKNGDFRKSTEHWLANYATLKNLNGGVKISNDGTSRTMRLIQNLGVKSSDLYYLNFKYTEATQNFKISVRYMPNSQKDSGVSGIYSSLGNLTGNYTNFQIEFIGELTNGNSIVVSNVILLNLTDFFGAGNEPSKTTLDWIIKENGYFEELSVSRDDVQQYEINQLRKAVLALGGTI